MKAFTTEQLQYLETVFGLKPVAETLPVRDGVVTRSTMVWWRASLGPEHVEAGSGTHWENIRRYPEVYQLAVPVTRVEYLD